jgi:hypothetical protein
VRRASTWAQRAEVRALASRGVPVRAIAALVFGEARLKGRVERILTTPSTAIEHVQAETAALALERGVTVEEAIEDAAGDDLDALLDRLEDDAPFERLDELIARLETDTPELAYPDAGEPGRCRGCGCTVAAGYALCDPCHEAEHDAREADA